MTERAVGRASGWEFPQVQGRQRGVTSGFQPGRFRDIGTALPHRQGRSAL